ncbi:MAG: fumarylacetoacetate hydrolase family protein [bacterium]|nr:fumarylacetoacetate hydrolase family protein [bacterium]
MTKHVRFSLRAGARPTTPDTDASVRYGILEEETIRETSAFSAQPNGTTHQLADVRLLPPSWPSSIVCVGRNYAKHAAELGNEPPSEPIIFFKPHSSLLADGDEIVYPAISKLVSFEGELGAVIGKRARHVSAGDAMSFVFGYTCVNDVTARDLQRKDKQWTRAKGFDTFGPMGPWIVPRDEVSLDQVRVRTTVDGVREQDAPISDMLFSLADIIAYVSSFMTLEPGDLIATGTPPGVAGMERGSTVRVELTGVGALENKLV